MQRASFEGSTSFFTCLGWPNVSTWARNAVIIANCNFKMAKTNRMHRKQGAPREDIPWR